ncbi:hypothetical protein Tco_0714566 [Tanacetum coccineum]
MIVRSLWREDVREVFQQRGSGAKRKLSRCGRNQMGNEPILALPEGADDFVVYYDARSKDLEACLEKGRRFLTSFLDDGQGSGSRMFLFVLSCCVANCTPVGESKVISSWIRFIELDEIKDSKRGPEFTWERKDRMRSKCPQLFVDSANASSS